MKEIYQIPRFSLAWLLIALFAVIVPHFARMPLWLIALCLLCIGGRILIFQGKLSYPGTLVKAGIVTLTFLAISIQYGRDILSTDANVAILVCSIALKLLEMKQKRDVLLIVYLCYFAVIAEFIYSQSIPIAAYMSFCVLLITSSLMSLNQTQAYQSPKRTLKMSGLILLQSIPLMLALFVLFPRMSPLWSVPLQTNAGVTGLSENMAPGDIGELIGSADVAFRVLFYGEPPPSAELYWRGITLDSFNGREWSRGFNIEPQFLGLDAQETRRWFETIEYLDNEVRYNIIMEPTFRNWIYTLKIPRILDDRLIMRKDYQVASIRRIGQRFSYDVRSFLDHRVDKRLGANERRRAVSLPGSGNEESQVFARAMREEAGSDEVYIQSLLSYFRTEPFFYTLRPALLGENTIDEFMFGSREGFCEHYASAFTYLMRAAGVPARVVTGYQGGEYNPYDGALTVRQYDAHAWSEVWLEGQGWIRIDPTAAVSPERIDQGSQLTLQEQESFLEDAGFSMLRFRNSLLLNDLRLRMEMIDYSWNRFVLNYDQELQFAFFSKLFSNVTQQKIIVTMLGFIFISVTLMVLLVLRKPSGKELHPATVIYLRYCAFLAKMGYERKLGEAPGHYSQRVGEAQPKWAIAMQSITDSYTSIIYKGSPEEGDNPVKVKHLKLLVRKFRMKN